MPEAQTTIITVLDCLYNMFRDNPVASSAIGVIVALVGLIFRKKDPTK